MVRLALRESFPFILRATNPKGVGVCEFPSLSSPVESVATFFRDECSLCVMTEGGFGVFFLFFFGGVGFFVFANHEGLPSQA